MLQDKTSDLTSKCFHQLFEDQAERTPDGIAVICEDQQLTYAELNARANQLARHLKTLGAGPEVLVAICVERSLEMAVGILGILKSGGAYLPLDPAYPQERLAFMLEDAQAPVVVTQSHIAQALPQHGAQAVSLDTDWPMISRQSGENLGGDARPENLAYVIYTSGSTGKPKGVMLTQANLSHYVLALQAELGITPEDRYLHMASIAFSSSRRQLMLPLSQGATVVIATAEQRKDPLALLEMMKRRGVTVMDAVPSFWRSCTNELASLETEARRGLLDNQLRLILSASEPLLSDLPRTWTHEFKHPAHHVHMFGQTETSGIVALHRISVRPDDQVKVVPIGRPIADTQIYLLDSDLNPVPTGEPGEMYISGAGVGRGYLNRPELTAEKFITNPFVDEPGARLYKTGDWARRLSDGNIEYLSRQDYQVKIRGFRVELGEIEALLTSHPAIRESAVIAREDVPGQKRLVAYIVPKRSSAPVSEISLLLKQRLPDYMMPSAFVQLEALPLTPNGKVDRRALPAPDEARPDLEEAFVAPRNPVEEVAAGILAEVLKLDRVGVNDNFFDLGGHSLLATQVISRLRRAFQVELPLRIFFETPTVAGLAKGIEEFRGVDSGLQLPPILPASREHDLPLSFSQESQWFLDQLNPNSYLYHINKAFRLRGSLNLRALEQTFDTIIARHEALRTTFVAVDGRPVQVINEPRAIDIPVIDLSDWPEAGRESEAQRRLDAEAKRPFDLARGPLVRATLLRLGEEEHLLLLSLHHIISDGWSNGLLLQEMITLYAGFAAGQASPLPELPIQYADYAVWQREWLQGKMLGQLFAYWKRKLAGAPAVLELPTDRPRPAVESFRGARQTILLPKSLSEALKGLSRHEGATLFMTLLAAFNALLARYCGQEDILVGSPIAGRTRVEAERLIGFFVNTLVLRTDLAGDPTFRELLMRVREMALGAYSHQDLPFEKLVEELQPERRLNSTPLFQVMFILQNTPKPRLEIPGLCLSLEQVSQEKSPVDLTLEVRETPDGLSCLFEYKTELFDASTITRMMEHYRSLLEGVVANPSEKVSALPLLTEAERRQLLVEWNATVADYSRDRCLHELIEAQVERTPDGLAVVCEEERLTYRELNGRANQLAHYLKTLGVGPEVLVGICVERSVEMVIGMLGILKAGGAYVPLDPAYPTQRLALMLEDADLPVLLTQRHLADELPEHKGKVVYLDQDWEQIAQSSIVNLPHTATPESPVYVIYTSGSTGRPKGVVIRHRSLVNYTEAAGEVYEIKSGDRALQFASISFDASAEEIYPCLTRGATLVLRTDAMLESVDAFLEHCRGWSITVLNLPTAYWHQLVARLDERPQSFPASVRLVIIGGERALPERLALWQKLVGSTVRLVNTYGPTEATVVATMCDLTHWTPADGALREVPIGRPVRNAQAYVLDRHLQPVPVGVPGELFIGGDGLARGYLNRPELTQARFIPNPFSAEAGDYLYRTGDLVRYLVDGQIEFLGRVDQQVKVRGFRIELGEIEAALNQHPLVRESVVIAREDVPGDKRLVAYIVPAQKREELAGELRRFLKERLPDYMVPSAFVSLAALPLSPNKKVDHRLLPAPDSARPELEKSYVPPRNQTEEVLAGIWSAVLGLKQVGVEDNFFELGGHSLLATQMISRLRDAFDVRLPLRCLFETPTVAGLAQAVGHMLAQKVETEEIASLLAQLEGLSEDEAQRLFADELQQ